MGNKAKLPPVPPANVSPQGSSTPGNSEVRQSEAENMQMNNQNQDERGGNGNQWQNTHHQGYQQDR
jgi:hypothetical protein